MPDTASALFPVQFNQVVFDKITKHATQGLRHGTTIDYHDLRILVVIAAFAFQAAPLKMVCRLCRNLKRSVGNQSPTD